MLEKSESASLCLQSLGASGIPLLLINQPELLFVPFLQRVMSTWYFLSGCELPLLSLQAGSQHADGAGGPTEKLGHGHCKHVQLLSGTLQVSLSTLLSSLSSKHGQRPLCCPSHQLIFQSAAVMPCTLGTWASWSTACTSAMV